MQEKLKVEDDATFSPVPLELVDYVWSSQIDAIERGMTKGIADWGTTEWLLGRIKDEFSLLWAVHRGEEIIGIVVTCVESNDLMKKLFVQLLAGENMHEWNWDYNLQVFRKYAEYVGADCIEAACRPGLARFLKNKGWSQKAIVMEF